MVEFLDLLSVRFMVCSQPRYVFCPRELPAKRTKKPEAKPSKGLRHFSVKVSRRGTKRECQITPRTKRGGGVSMMPPPKGKKQKRGGGRADCKRKGDQTVNVRVNRLGYRSFLLLHLCV